MYMYMYVLYIQYVYMYLKTFNAYKVLNTTVNLSLMVSICIQIHVHCSYSVHVHVCPVYMYSRILHTQYVKVGVQCTISHSQNTTKLRKKQNFFHLTSLHALLHVHLPWFILILLIISDTCIYSALREHACTCTFTHMCVCMHDLYIMCVHSANT